MRKQIMILFSALLVIFTVLPSIQPASAAEAVAQEEMEFELPLKVFKAGTQEVSTAADFVSSSAKIVVEDGKTFAYVTLLNSQYWQSLKVQKTQPGKFTDANFLDAKLVSKGVIKVEGEDVQTRLVKFEVPDLSKELNVKAHIIVTGVPGLGEYDHTYDLHFSFDDSKIPETPEVPEETPTPEIIKDGAYTIGVDALHADEDTASSMARYIETPAALTVKNGKNLVTMILKDNEQITEFQVEQDGKFEDATIVETDIVGNTRVVEFEVANIHKIINTKFTVFVEAHNHTGNYDVRLKFDAESIKAIEEEVVVTFADIKNSSAKKHIESLATRDIIKGKTPTTFAPGAEITRAQFAVLLSRALELPLTKFSGTFTDVSENMKSSVYHIEAANHAGIIHGSGGKFNPNAPITREQMAAMIIRTIEYEDASLLEGITSTITFSDAKKIVGYAVKPVNLATGLGIINGREVEGKMVFEPKANATRAHAAIMIYNMLENLQ